MGFDVALDNTRFGQTPPPSVPEPHWLGLAALAALVLGRVRSR
jgi:MYXO-CTERM domain-containing protein